MGEGLAMAGGYPIRTLLPGMRRKTEMRRKTRKGRKSDKAARLRSKSYGEARAEKG
jgi:hypothetical protein